MKTTEITLHKATERFENLEAKCQHAFKDGNHSKVFMATSDERYELESVIRRINAKQIKKFANLIMYTDVEPYEVIRKVSDITVEIRKMDTTLNPNWKPNTISGGFVGHTINNRSQEYSYKSDENILPKESVGQKQMVVGSMVHKNSQCQMHHINFTITTSRI
jgi:hypothetical protein